MKLRSRRVVASSRALTAGLAAVLVVAGCTTMVNGRAVSVLNDPFRVGGLPATDGPSGVKPNGPAPTGTVLNTNNGPIDKLSLLSVNDIEEFWKNNYIAPLQGSFKPVDKLVSYDSTTRTARSSATTRPTIWSTPSTPPGAT